MNVTLEIEPLLYDFYRKIGANVGKPPEQVMADALFRLAGELSMEAIAKKSGLSNEAKCNSFEIQSPTNSEKKKHKSDETRR